MVDGRAHGRGQNDHVDEDKDDAPDRAQEIPHKRDLGQDLPDYEGREHPSEHNDEPAPTARDEVPDLHLAHGSLSRAPAHAPGPLDAVAHHGKRADDRHKIREGAQDDGLPPALLLGQHVPGAAEVAVTPETEEFFFVRHDSPNV